MKVNYDDESGERLCDACWFAPVEVAEGEICTIDNIGELKEFADQYLLLLPKLDDDGEYMNMYHVVGHKWTEREEKGTFENPQLSKELFGEWLQQHNTNNDNESNSSQSTDEDD